MTEDTKLTLDCIDRRRVLRGSVGLATGALVTTAAIGTAAAHFPSKLDVDVEPGSDRNRIVPGSDGLVLVAVLQTDGFDPTSEGVHYRFGAPAVVDNGGGARPRYGGSLADVDGDGRMDLLLHFPTRDTGFGESKGVERNGKLVWERHEGAKHGYSGTDAVTIGRFVPARSTPASNRPVGNETHGGAFANGTAGDGR